MFRQGALDIIGHHAMRKQIGRERELGRELGREGGS